MPEGQLPDYALVTVEEARLFVRRNRAVVDPDGTDPLLETLIDGYSDLVRRFTEREFAPAEDAQTRRFRWDGGRMLDLSPYDLRAVTSVTLYSDLDAGSQVALTSGDFRAEPRNKTREGTYLWLTLRERCVHQLSEWRGIEVAVLGDWGCSSVPGLVKTACLKAIAADYRNPEGFQSRSFGELQFSEPSESPETAGRALPPAARDMLAPFRRGHYLGS